MNELNSIMNFRFENTKNFINNSLIYVVNRAGCNLNNKDFYIKRNESYEYCVLHYVFFGDGYLEVGDKTYRLSTGDLFVLGPGEKHIYQSIHLNNIGVLWAEFYGSNVNDFFKEFSKNDIRVIHSNKNSAIFKELYHLINYLKTNKEQNNFEISRKIYSLISSVSEVSLNQETLVTHLPIHIHQVIYYISSHIYDKITVADLSNHVGYSYSYFERSFKKHIGKSVAKYILEKKIECALRLLQNGNLTCEIVSSKLGFCDVSHFFKCFKRVTGKKVSEFI